MRNVLSFAVFMMMLLLVGCSSTISNVSAYKQCVLEECDVMPTSEQLSDSKAKVVVLEFRENDDPKVKSANLAKTVPGYIESILGSGGVVEIVDREAAQSLQDEIVLSEMEGDAIYEGPQVADFAISGTIDSANLTKRYSEGRYYTDKSGKQHYLPAQNAYTAEVRGKIRVYELPSLKVVKLIDFSDNARHSEEAGTGRVSGKVESLMQDAAHDAISSARIDLFNFFAKKAFVLEKRQRDDEEIYKINRGSEAGLKEGDKCNVFTTKRYVNPISKEETFEDLKLGECEVSNQLGSSYAWLTIDGELQQPIRLGDFVRVVTEAKLSDMLNSTGKFLNSLAK